MNEELELTKEALKGPIGELLRNICGPVSIEIGETFGAWARTYRMTQGLKMLQKTQRMLRDAGINPKTVSPRLFLPILESASVEDDGDMQTRWAALLANSVADDKVHPSFIETLKRLTPSDAKLLDSFYDQKSRVVRLMQETADQFQILVSLGLVAQEYDYDDSPIRIQIDKAGRAEFKPSKLDDWYYLTKFAEHFVKACRPPLKQEVQTSSPV
jgi:hypothetical protein